MHLLFFSLWACILHGQEADDGSQVQRSRLLIGNGLQGGDLVALSLIKPDENKVELTVLLDETPNALRDRLVTGINTSVEASVLVLASAGGEGEILLHGKTKGEDIAVYFDTSGADVLKEELIHRAVPANEQMIPGYVKDSGYNNSYFAVNVIHQGEWFLNADPGQGGGTMLNAEDGNYSSEIEDGDPLSIDASGWSAGTHRVGMRFADEFGDWSGIRWFYVEVVDPGSIEAEPEGRPEEADLTINPGFSAGDAYLVEVNGTEYRYVVGTDDNVSDVQDGLYQLLIAGNPGVSIARIGPDGLRLTGTGYQILGIKLKYEGGATGSTDSGQSARGIFPLGYVSPVTRYFGGAEYFVGNDPGEGNGIAVQAEDLLWDEETEGVTLPDLDPATWSGGDKRIGFRFVDDLGRWGPVWWHDISVFDPTSVDADPAYLAQTDTISLQTGFQPGDWFRVTIDGVDYDYNATSSDLNATRDGLLGALSGNPKADAAALPGGIIRLTGKIPGDSYLVGIDGNASGFTALSSSSARPVFPLASPSPVFRTIGGAEYFVNDPNATEILNPEDLAFDEEHEGILPIEINATLLTGGNHRIGLRFKDDLGRWSPYNFLDLIVFDASTVEADSEERDQVTELVIGQDFVFGDELNCTLNGIFISLTYQSSESFDDFCQRLCDEVNARCSGFCTAIYLGNGRCQFTCSGGPSVITCVGSGTIMLNQTVPYRPLFPSSEQMPATRYLTGGEYFLNDSNNPQSFEPEDLHFDQEHEGISPLSIDGSALSAGVHRIGLRFQDDLGQWSPFRYVDLTVFDPSSVQPDPPSSFQTDFISLKSGFQPGDWFRVTIDGVHYDYNATSPDLNTTRDGLIGILSGNPKADVIALTGGGIRLTGKTPGDSYLVGLESNSTTQPELTGESGRGVFPDGASTPVVRKLSQAEYFVGSDPGEGAGISLAAEDFTYDEETEGATAISLNPSAWTPGITRIGARFRNDDGNWGSVNYTEVTVFDPSTVAPDDAARAQQDLLAWTNSPSPGESYHLDLNGTRIEYLVQPDDNHTTVRDWFWQYLQADFTLSEKYSFSRDGDRSLIVEGKTAGQSYWVHLDGNGSAGTSHLRRQDSRGVFTESSVSLAPVRLAGAEYFINQDPGVGLAIPMTEEALPWRETTVAEAAVSTLGLGLGEHRIGVRFRDSFGKWSPVRWIHFGLDSLEEGLAGHWKLDDNDSVALDSSGLARHGTLSAMEAKPWELGKLGLALRFELSAGRVDLSEHAVDFRELNQSISLSMWIKWEDQNNESTLFELSDANGDAHYLMSTLAGKVMVKDNLGNSLEGVISQTNENWRFVAFTSTASSSTLYVDGEKVANGVAMPIHFSNQLTSLSIGASPNGTNPFAGSIDDVRLYGRELNPNEIKLLFELANRDADSDGLTDGIESFVGGNPGLDDTDGDGLTDGEEFFTHRTRLDSNDSDGDGLSDLSEIQGYVHQQSGKTFVSNPLAVDTDGDGYSDYAEVEAGRDPDNAEEFPNEAPTGIVFDAVDLFENQPAGSPAGKFSAIDPNRGDVVLLSIASINGSPYLESVSPFRLESNSTGRLVATRSLDHEVDGNISIRILATDSFGKSLSKDFVIQALDDANDLDEDGLSNEEELDLGTNPNLSDTDQDGHSDKAEIEAGTDPLDETDWPGKENTPPSDISLLPEYPLENQPEGVLAASLRAIDPDKKDFHFFSLVRGEGDDHNDFFTLNLATGDLTTAKVLDYEINPDHNYSIRVEVSDDRGGKFSKELKIPVANDDSEDTDQDGLSEKQERDMGLDDSIPDFDDDGHLDGQETVDGTDPKDPFDPRPPNNPPTEIILSSDTIRENKEPQTKIGDFISYDPNPWDKFFHYSLVDGNGSTDNAAFMVDGNGSLLSSKTLNHEEKNLASIRVRTTDEAGGFLERVFLIKVLDDSNEDADEDGLSELEEEYYGTSDILRDTDGDQFEDLREIEEGTDPTDPEDYPLENHPPSNLTLSPNQVIENSPLNTLVGTFAIEDEDLEDDHEMVLIEGEGDTDNFSFVIEDDTLRTRDLFDHERKSAYSIRVMARDLAGLSVERVFDISILNDDEEDKDGDGLIEKLENELGTDDENPDTDGDGAGDGYERQHGSDPLDPNDSPKKETGFAWVRTGGADLADNAHDVATDEHGNSYVLGTFEGNVEFEGGLRFNSSGGSDVFVVKFDTHGLVQWGMSFRGAGNDHANSISLSDDGHLLVSGSYGRSSRWQHGNHSLQIGETHLPEGTAAGSAFIAKLNALENGKVIWAHGLPSFDSGLSRSSDSMLDQHGNAYLVGYFHLFASLPDNKFLMSWGSKIDGFALKFDQSGKLKWSTTLAGKGDDFIDALSVSPNNEIHLACRVGAFTSSRKTVTIGAHEFTNDGKGASLIARLSAKGSYLSKNFLALGSNLRINDLASTPTGIAGVGIVSSPVKIEGTELSPGGFVFGLDDGSHQFSLLKSSSAANQCTVNSDGEIISIGNSIEKISAEGDTLWSFPASGTSVSADGRGSLYLCGNFSQKREFDPFVKTSKGLSDAFVAKVGSFVPNSAPFGLLESSLSILENLPPTAVFAKLQALDSDWGDLHQFRLIREADYPDNQYFEIRGRNELLPREVLNYEDRSEFVVFVEIHDGKGGLWEGELPISVSDDDKEDEDNDGLIEEEEEKLGLSDYVPDFDGDGHDDFTEINKGSDPKDANSIPTGGNRPPTSLVLSHSEIPENSPSGTAIGLLSALDADLEDSHEFFLSGNLIGNKNFEIVENELRSRISFDFELEAQYLIEISVRDSAGGIKSKLLQITVEDLPEFEPPANLFLLTNEIDENLNPGAIVGKIQVVDPNLDDSHSLKLAQGEESFTINEEGMLLSSAIFDHELKSQYPIAIRATDPAGLSIEKEFIVYVRDVYENLPVEDISLSSNEVFENQPKGTKIGVLTAVDPNQDDTHTFILEKGKADFELSATGQLSSVRPFDFERQSEFSIRVRVVDGDGYAFRKEFRIKVLDVFENLLPSPPSVSANLAKHGVAGQQTIGFLQSQDPEDGGSLHYSFNSGLGDDDNTLFKIQDDQLILLSSSNYFVRRQYSVRVQARDKMDGVSSAALLIFVAEPDGAALFGSLIGSSPPWPTDFKDSDNDGFDDRWQAKPFAPTQQPPDFHAILTIVYGGKEVYETTRKVVRGNSYPLRSTTYERGWKFKKWDGYGVKDPTKRLTSILVEEDQKVFAVYSRSLRGKYVNGYVVGAVAFLDSSLNGGFNGILDDFEPRAITDESGGFNLEISDEQYDMLDIDGSGEIEDDEGQIVCTGGTDVSTGLPVSVSFKSPVSSEYVTPLTTILSDLMTDGRSADQAQEILKESFLIDESVDLLAFDSVAEAGIGNQKSLRVLNASTQIAVTLSLVNTIVDSGSEDQGDSNDLSGKISKAIATQILNPTSEGFDLEAPSTIGGILEESAKYSDLSLEQESLEAASYIISSMNLTLKENSLDGTDPASYKKNAAENQMASASAISPTLRMLAGKFITPSQAYEQAGPEVTQRVSALMVANNSFAPTINESFLFYGPDKRSSLRIDQLTATDADGDTSLNFSILSGNVDLDEDGNQLLDLNSTTGLLRLEDLDDLSLISGETLTIEVEVSDQGGLSSSRFLYLVLSDQSLLQAVSESVGNQWFDSDWFGLFYGVTGSDWVYHKRFGWTYVAHAEIDGGWTYTHNLGWLWIRKSYRVNRQSMFAYSYERESWLFYREFDDGAFLFDYSINSWISILGENLGTSLVHEDLGLIFKGNDPTSEFGDWYTHPIFGKMPPYVDLKQETKHFPFFSNKDKSWSVAGIEDDGQLELYDSSKPLEANLEEVWSLLENIEGSNPTDVIQAINTHDWIEPRLRNYIKGRLVFGLPIE